MMKRLICFLALLCLVSTACAQEAMPYVPGETSKTLFIEAFERGEMVCIDLYGDMTFSENAAALYGLDGTMLGAISEILRHTGLTVGAAQLENGLRLLLAGQYTADDGQSAGLDATLDITADGVSLMSSVIPGERVTATWDTLMQLAGVSAADLDMLLNANKADMLAMVDELAAQSEASMELIAQIAAPYLQTISEHIAALPMEVLENVPADAGFPAAATELNLTITGKAVGDLLIALAGQLEQDATLCAILDNMLAESGEDVTTVQLCQAIRQSAAESLTDEEYPIYVYVGMDEMGNFLYLNIVVDNSEGESFIIALMNVPAEENPSLTKLSLDALLIDAADQITDGVTFSALYTGAEAEAADVQVYMDLYAESEAVFSGEFKLNGGAFVSEDALRGESYAWSLVLAALDGEDVLSMMLSTESLKSETAEGGEQSTFTCALDIGDGSMHIPMTCEVYTLTEAAQSGPTMSVSAFFTAPTLGVSKCLQGCTLRTAVYTPDLSAMTSTALETASPEALEALAQRAMLNAQGTVSALFELLPAALTAAAM